ncbi:MAG: thiamine phosphate synthase [Bacteroidetes bacterium]|nr:thiamine phosphate synthase [Bacteroidota bacterium]
MKLIVITSSQKNIENETQIVTKLFESGLETLHLRKPRYSTKQLTQYIQEIPVHFHNRIIIHSHHNLAWKFKLKGIHLTRSHRNKKLGTWLTIKIAKYKNKNLLITASHRRLSGLFEETEQFDYVFLSPIFDSLTSNYQSGFTEHSLRSALEKLPLKVVARGGVDLNTAHKVKDIGFVGMALFSGLWKKADPVKEFNAIVNKLTELGIKIE